MCRRTDTKLRSARGKQNYRKVLSLDMSQSDEDKDEECFLKAYEKAALQQNVNRAIEVERHKWISDIKRDIIKVLDGASNDHPTITKTEAESAELLSTEERHMQSVSIADADIVYTITEDCTIATQDDNSTQFLLESEEQVPSSTPREHVCNVCGKSFSKKGVLNRHARIHAQEKRFVCGVCGKGFVQNETLKRHQYKHSVLKPFPCRFCAKAFIERSLLRSHIEKEHNSGSGHYAAPVRLPCKLCLKVVNLYPICRWRINHYITYYYSTSLSDILTQIGLEQTFTDSFGGHVQVQSLQQDICGLLLEG